MAAISVSAIDRLDDKTILCSVDWRAPGQSWVKIKVQVNASLDEFHMRQGAKEAPALPDAIKGVAISRAQEAARACADVEV